MLCCVFWTLECVVPRIASVRQRQKHQVSPEAHPIPVGDYWADGRGAEGRFPAEIAGGTFSPRAFPGSEKGAETGVGFAIKKPPPPGLLASAQQRKDRAGGGAKGPTSRRIERVAKDREPEMTVARGLRGRACGQNGSLLAKCIPARKSYPLQCEEGNKNNTSPK
jgi:hypothetical protein